MSKCWFALALANILQVFGCILVLCLEMHQSAAKIELGQVSSAAVGALFCKGQALTIKKPEWWALRTRSPD